jgi:prevent-host-death family protein
MRRAVGSRELKTRLGTYLREVQGGATIVVTERGRPVAELRPVQPADSLEERLNQMAAKGLLSRGTGRPLRPFEPIKISGPPISQTIIEDREDRF